MPLVYVITPELSYGNTDGAYRQDDHCENSPFQCEFLMVVDENPGKADNQMSGWHKRTQHMDRLAVPENMTDLRLRQKQYLSEPVSLYKLVGSLLYKNKKDRPRLPFSFYHIPSTFHHNPPITSHTTIWTIDRINPMDHHLLCGT